MASVSASQYSRNDVETMETSMVSNIPTSNRYTLLSHAFVEEEVAPRPSRPPSPRLVPAGVLPAASQPRATADGSATRRASAKTPPIYVTKYNCSARVLENQLTDLCGSTFKLKLLKEGIRVQFDNKESHVKFIKFLRENNLSFFSFTPNSEKILSLALKGLPQTPTDEVLDELRKAGLHPTSCNVIGRSASRPVFRINFPAGTSLSVVNKVGFLFHIRVYWDKFFSKKTHTQCFRCQAFGHSASNCNVTPRCVKCAGGHHTSQCSKPLDVVPTCVNCKGQHTANFSKCPALLNYLNVRERKPVARAAPKPSSTPSHLSDAPRHVPGLGRSLTFANVVSGVDPRRGSTGARAAPVHSPPSPPLPCGDQGTFLDFASEVSKLNSLVDLDLMLSTIRKLNNILAHCQTNGEKFRAFIQVLKELK